MFVYDSLFVCYFKQYFSSRPRGSIHVVGFCVKPRPARVYSHPDCDPRNRRVTVKILTMTRRKRRLTVKILTMTCWKRRVIAKILTMTRQKRRVTDAFPSFQHHASIILASFWHHSSIISASFGHNFGIIRASYGQHSTIIRG